MSNRTRLRAGAAAAVLLLAGGALTGCSANGADGETTTIRYQSSAGGVDLGELADALGYLDGLKLERVGDVQGGPEAMRAVATDQVDYGSAFNGAIAKLASTGAPITAVVASYGSEGAVSSSLLTMEDSGIESARDLIGKKVAVNTLGANAEAVLDTYLVEGGLSSDEIEEVTLVPLPGINAEAALREGQVDASYLFGALREIAVQNGDVKELVNDIDLVGPYNGGSYVMSDKFLEENPDTVEKFIAGVSKAIEYARTHPVEEVREVMTDYLEEHGRGDFAEPLKLWQGTGIPAEGGVISDDDFTLWLDWLEGSGEVDEGAIEPSEIYTNEYNPTAKEQ